MKTLKESLNESLFTQHIHYVCPLAEEELNGIYKISNNCLLMPGDESEVKEWKTLRNSEVIATLYDIFVKISDKLYDTISIYFINLKLPRFSEYDHVFAITKSRGGSAYGWFFFNADDNIWTFIYGELFGSKKHYKTQDINEIIKVLNSKG